MKESRRTRQLSDVIRAELARLIREELRDPNIGFVTLTGVAVAPDLSTARVFVSVFGSQEQFEKSVAALNHASGRLRGIVGRNCKLRHAPVLSFVEDHSVERGARVEELLHSIQKPEGDDGPGQENP